MKLSLRRINRLGDRPYLQRFGRKQSADDAWRDRLRGTWRARLHRFVGPDDAGHHNHPFAWSFSIVFSALWGASYDEEVLTLETCDWHQDHPHRGEGWPHYDFCLGGACDRVRRRRVRFFNWIPQAKYHRIVKLNRGWFGLGVWTLFITGPRVASWGFWEPGRGHIPWKQYNREKDCNVHRS